MAIDIFGSKFNFWNILGEWLVHQVNFGVKSTGEHFIGFWQAANIVMEEKSSTIEKFIDPSQWMVWKFQIRVNLMAADIFGYVNGTKKTPDAADKEHDKKLVEWTKNDAKAQKIIVNSCGSKVLIHLCNCSTASQMWTKLHSVFEQSNEAAKQLLQEKFFAYKKDPAHDIATHISTLESLVQ